MRIAPARKAALDFLFCDRWLESDWDERMDGFLSQPALADPRDRRLFTRLVSGTVRLMGRLDDRLERLSRRERFDDAVQAALRLALFQLEESERLPDHAVIGESVEWVKRKRGARLAGWTNAQLRNWQRSGVPGPDRVFEEDPQAYCEYELSYPEWLVRRWIAELGASRAREICESMNGREGITFRWNERRPGRQAFLEILRAENCSLRTSEELPNCFRVQGAVPARVWEGLDRGLLSVQDEASQRVAPLLAPSPGLWVDLCAAPGGKAGHLAEIAPAGTEILALDRSGPRLEKVVANLARLGFSGLRIEQADLRERAPEVADAVLLDAPCSALGVLAENPDARWRKGEEQIPRLAAMQDAMLEAASRWVKPGGLLIYSVCTLSPEETWQRRDAFLERFREFRLDRIRPEEAGGSLAGEVGDLLVWPDRAGGSGGYTVRFKRMDA